MTTPALPCVSTLTFGQKQTSRPQITHEFFLLWAQAVPLVTLALTTMVCNGLVLWMFKVKRSLRSCKNVFLASLALADFIIGLCMLVTTGHQIARLAGYRGLDRHVDDSPPLTHEKSDDLDVPTFAPVSLMLGSSLCCRLYLILRQGSLYVSLLSILLITMDRWWSIHYPFSYRARRSKRVAVLAVMLLWIFAFSTHIVSVTMWDWVLQIPETNTQRNASSAHLNGWDSSYSTRLPRSHSECQLPFAHNFPFMFIVSAAQYVIPLSAMLILNGSLYIGILGRKRVQIRRSVSSSDRLNLYDISVTSINEVANNSNSLDDCAQQRLSELNTSQNGSKPHPRNTVELYNLYRRRSTAAEVILRGSAVPKKSLSPRAQTRLELQRRRSSLALRGSISCGVIPSSSFKRAHFTPMRATSSFQKEGEKLAKELMVRQDRRAAVWLGLLVLVFLVCWLPHTALSVLRAHHADAVPNWALDLSLWVLLANSAVNPLLYGLFNKEIRRAFRAWACGSKNRYRLRNALIYHNINAVAAGGRRSSTFGNLDRK